MARSHLRPTYVRGRNAYDFACECGEQSAPVPTPEEADRQREEHMRTAHNQERAGIREETSEYQRLNRAANDAAAKVSRWHGGTKRGK